MPIAPPGFYYLSDFSIGRGSPFLESDFAPGGHNPEIRNLSNLEYEAWTRLLRAVLDQTAYNLARYMHVLRVGVRLDTPVTTYLVLAEACCGKSSSKAWGDDVIAFSGSMAARAATGKLKCLSSQLFPIPSESFVHPSIENC